MSAPAFKRGTVIALAIVCTISLVGLGLLGVFGPDLVPTRSGEADVYSMSGVGHGALVDVLHELGRPTTIHRNPEALPLEGDGVLLVLEPHHHLCEGGADRPGLAELLAHVPAALIALPKWQVRTNEERPPWVTALAPLPEDEVLAPLVALGLPATVLRYQVRREQALSTDEFSMPPRFPSSYRQYVRSAALEPLLADARGIVLGRTDVEGTTVYVLADPDLLANHGLHRGANATMVVRWLDNLRAEGPIAFDETLHGFPPREESMLRELFRFPLVLALLHAIAIVLLVMWAGLGRFGDSPPPDSGIEPGSGFLIRHTAWLLRFGRHTETALRRYIEDVAREVAGRFHLSSGLSRAARDARLDELGSTRQTGVAWTTLKQRALDAASARGPRREAEALRAAHALYQWKREILDGPRSDSRTAQETA